MIASILRTGRTRRLLGGWLPAPSTLGTFLPAFTFGHLRQLDQLLAETLTRAWRAGAGPPNERLVVDVDSFIGEVLHIRLRKGRANSSRGVLRSAEELIARVGRAGASGEKPLRADSAFWNKTLMKRPERAGRCYSISIRCQKDVTAAIAQVPKSTWQTIEDYPDDGEAHIAETTYGTKRMIARRTRLIGAQAEPWPDWRHFPFLTNRTDALEVAEAEHRHHADVELTIRDLKDHALAHFPSGQFNANSAWTVISAIAHNLTRWTTVIGLPGQTIRAAHTLRRRLLQIPGRLTRTARQRTLHPPARWPWQHDFVRALSRIRELPTLVRPTTPTTSPMQTRPPTPAPLTAARKPPKNVPAETSSAPIPPNNDQHT